MFNLALVYLWDFDWKPIRKLKMKSRIQNTAVSTRVADPGSHWTSRKNRIRIRSSRKKGSKSDSPYLFFRILDEILLKNISFWIRVLLTKTNCYLYKWPLNYPSVKIMGLDPIKISRSGFTTGVLDKNSDIGANCPISAGYLEFKLETRDIQLPNFNIVEEQRTN